MSFYLNRKYKEWITNMHDAGLALELDTSFKNNTTKFDFIKDI